MAGPDSITAPSDSSVRPSLHPTPSVSGLEIYVVVRELAPLVGTYVSSIHALGEAQLLRLKRPVAEVGEGSAGREAEFELLLSPKHGAWITHKPSYTFTASFTTALRAELLRLKLESVTQHDLDRVIVFRFSGREVSLKLILELIPPGNLILTDGTDRIVLALRDSRGGSKRVGRGRLYSPPPKTRASPDEVDEKSLTESFSKEKTVGRALGRGMSLPKKYVDEVLARSSLKQDDLSSKITSARVKELMVTIKELIASLDTPSPSLVEMNGAVELMSVRPSAGAALVRHWKTMSELMDELFTPSLLEQEEREDRAHGNESQPTQKARELEVTLQRLGDQARDLMKRAARLRELAAAVEAASSPEQVNSLMVQAQSEEEGETTEIGEVARASLASRLYDQAKRSEAEVARIGEVEREIAARLEGERGRAQPPTSKVKVARREKKEWFEKFRWFFTTEGRLAIGGRDAQSNAILLKRYSDERDVVYHADLFGSPFFVLKDGNKKQTEAERRQLGQATAAFSSAWKTGLASADAYWVDPEQVSSSAPSGEYLAKGSFVIRGSKNFVTRNPVEVSVGVDKDGRVMAGPEEAVIRLSRAHVTLIPHREKASDTAKKVLFELRKYFSRELEGASLDEVLRVLPAGGGKIVRRRENWKNAPAEK